MNADGRAPLPLPRPDDATLRAYLLNVAEAICRQVNGGLADDAPLRLRECATIVARVAQHLGEGRIAADVLEESEALNQSEPAFEASEAARSDAGRQAAGAAQRHIDRAALQCYLQAHALGGPRLQLTEARLIPGGRCKVTAMISQTGAAQLPEHFIFRQDWQGGATDTTVAGEFALLQLVSASGIRAPRPLLLEPAHGAVGAPFILLEKLPGRLTGSLFTPPRSRELGLQLAQQMGLLHGLPAERSRGLAPAALAREDLARQIGGFAGMQQHIGIRARVIDAAITWLSAHVEDAGSEIRLTHNDLGFHNFLVEGDTLSAVLDWELASQGHPAADLGYVKPFVSRMLPWPDFVQQYEQSGGWKVELRELRFHTIYNAVRLYGLIMQARAALVAGFVNDVEIAFACADATPMLLQALGNELREASA